MIFVLLQSALWGAGNPIAKLALNGITPFWCLSIRFSLATILFIVIFRKKAFSLNKNNIGRCAVIAFFTAAAYITSTVSLVFTTATTAGFLMSLSVVFTPFLARIIGGKALNKRIVPIVALVVAGTYFLCGGGGQFSFGVGEVLALLSSVALAITLAYSARYAEGIEEATLSTMQAGLAAVLSVVCAFIFEGRLDFAAIAPASWWGIAYLVVACTLVAYMLQNAAIKHISAFSASLAYSTEPIFTALVAYWLLGEVLLIRSYIGGVLVLTGLALAALVQRSDERRRAAQICGEEGSMP